MTNIWRISLYEYRRQVFRRGFLFAILSVPLFIAVMALIVVLLINLESQADAVGYVDQSTVLENPVPAPAPGTAEKPVEIIPYVDEAAARQALDAGEVQAYLVLPPDYLESGQIRMVYLEAPGDNAEDQFRDFLRANLLDGQPVAVQDRFTEGIELTVVSADGQRVVHEADWFNVFVPVLAGFAFIMALFITSGYLLQAVVEEKENRTMEIVVTSVSTNELILGKTLGITGVGLTQILAWVLVAVLGVSFGGRYLEWMRALRLSLDTVGTLTLIYLPAYVMIGAIMVAIGSTVTEAREGQQLTGLITLPVTVPYWLMGQIMFNPNSPLAIGLSFFPLTAPVTLSIRIGFGTVPTWQLALHILFLFLSAGGALWLAGRAFRLGMLRYGQRLKLKELFGRSA